MTTQTTRRLATGLSAAVLACAAIAPGAVAQQDLRMPDTRDAATLSGGTQDLRSPDTRDLAAGYSPAYVPEPVSSSSSSSGFDWVSAAIGAAAIGGVILLVVAGVGTRRHGHGPRPAGA